MASAEFQRQIIDLLPKMRRWARSHTYDAAAADDLVQDVVMKALLASTSFTPGTNFPAWVRQIMYHHFISGVRKRRNLIGLDEILELPVAAAQQSQTDVRELGLAFHSLPEFMREALHLIVIQERTYEEVAVTTGIAIGTIKSRVHRARLQLRAHMEHEAQTAA